MLSRGDCDLWFNKLLHIQLFLCGCLVVFKICIWERFPINSLKWQTVQYSCHHQNYLGNIFFNVSRTRQQNHIKIYQQFRPQGQSFIHFFVHLMQHKFILFQKPPVPFTKKQRLYLLISPVACKHTKVFPLHFTGIIAQKLEDQAFKKGAMIQGKDGAAGCRAEVKNSLEWKRHKLEDCG